MLIDLERRVKILQCLSTSLTKIHSARATGGGGRLPRVMKVACTWWRRWGQNRAISHTSLVLFRGHFPNKNEAIRTSDSDASWTTVIMFRPVLRLEMPPRIIVVRREAGFSTSRLMTDMDPPVPCFAIVEGYGPLWFDPKLSEICVRGKIQSYGGKQPKKQVS